MARETLVMLPGMMCDARLFGPQIAALQNDYDIVVPLLKAPASVIGMAQGVLAAVSAPEFNLVGLSMGGIVALALVGLAPGRVKRLALLDTNCRADAAERYDMRCRQIEDVRQGKLRKVITEEMKPNYLARVNRNDESLLKLLVTMAMELGEDAFISQSIALRDRPEQRATLASYQGPTLILCGAEDTICPPALHREMALLVRNTILREIEGAGHISTLERPDAVTAEFQDWLRRAN